MKHLTKCYDCAGLIKGDTRVRRRESPCLPTHSKHIQFFRPAPQAKVKKREQRTILSSISSHTPFRAIKYCGRQQSERRLPSEYLLTQSEVLLHIKLPRSNTSRQLVLRAAFAHNPPTRISIFPFSQSAFYLFLNLTI